MTGKAGSVLQNVFDQGDRFGDAVVAGLHEGPSSFAHGFCRVSLDERGNSRAEQCFVDDLFGSPGHGQCRVGFGEVLYIGSGQDRTAKACRLIRVMPAFVPKRPTKEGEGHQREEHPKFAQRVGEVELRVRGHDLASAAPGDVQLAVAGERDQRFGAVRVAWREYQ